MKKYFIHNGAEQQGPFNLEELKAKNINKSTLVWYDGLSGWTSADKIEELKEIIQTSTPPPFETTQATPPPINNRSTPYDSTTKSETVKKKNRIGKAILIGVIAVGAVAGGLVLFENMNKGSNGSEDTYQEKVLTIEQIERATPTDFLNASGTYKENFWGDKFKVECAITNKATVATYKDAVIRVTYYSKTQTALGSNDYTVYETFPPTSTKTVELKIDKYKNVSSLGWDVVSAVSY